MKNTPVLFPDHFSNQETNQCLKFKAIANEISSLASTVGIDIVPFKNEKLEHFLKLNSMGRESVLKSIEVYLNVYKAVQAEGASLLDSVRVIWNALIGFGFRPTSDLFNYIKAGKVIEIHNRNLVQVFRNFAFFKYCSYSLEELYCHPLAELYSREDSVNQNLMEYLQKLYSGSIKSVLPIDLKAHLISELASETKLQIYDQIHFMAPLFSSSGGTMPVATITIESADLDYEVLASEVANKPPVENLAKLFEFKPRDFLNPGYST